jgi:hypothetical protein
MEAYIQYRHVTYKYLTCALSGWLIATRQNEILALGFIKGKE